MDSKLFSTTPTTDKIILTKKQIAGRNVTQTTMAWRIVKVSIINPILQAACKRSIFPEAQLPAQKDAQKSRKMRKTAVQRRRRGWNQKPISGIYCPEWYGMAWYGVYCVGRWIERTHCPALFLPLNRQGG
jgi:hypothetical protein